jgi:hypothetical protein
MFNLYLIRMRFLFFSGIIFFVGSIILINANYYILDIERNGKVVKMKIEQLPKTCYGGKVRYFVTYSYEGKMYDKATRGNYCEEHYIGELVDMKFLQGSKEILRPNESALMNLLFFAALGVLGAVISAIQWRKMKR